jgi:hypothetical protein
MPSFPSEIIEEWRQKRVSDHKINENLISSVSQAKVMLRVCEEDIDEEISRLQSAREAVRTCSQNIRSLEKKKNKLELVIASYKGN